MHLTALCCVSSDNLWMASTTSEQSGPPRMWPLARVRTKLSHWTWSTLSSRMVERSPVSSVSPSASSRMLILVMSKISSLSSGEIIIMILNPGSEALRCLGYMRAYILVVMRLFCPKTYLARVSYLPLPTDPATGKPKPVSPKEPPIGLPPFDQPVPQSNSENIYIRKIVKK